MKVKGRMQQLTMTKMVLQLKALELGVDSGNFLYVDIVVVRV